MNKVLLVTNIPTPYRIPLFNTLSGMLEERGWHLKVVFAAPTYARRQWRIDPESIRFDYAMLAAGKRTMRRRHPVFLYRGLLSQLIAEWPDIVISAGFSIGTLKSWMWSMISGGPMLIWSGSVGEERGSLRRAYRSFLARRAAGGVCYGSKAREYLASLGMPEDRLWVALNTVDVGFFRDGSGRNGSTSHVSSPATEGNRPELSPISPGYRNGTVSAPRRILCVGDLIRRKRVDLLLHAVKELSRRREDFVLQIIGDGPLEEPLRRLADELEIAHLVRFEGYRPNDMIPSYLAAASAFAFPTGRDIWGLVLIEAMAAGLPCVASTRAGATNDVIEHGVNGFAADYSDAVAVADHFEWILERPDEAAEMGRRASRFVSEKLSLEACAGGFYEAVHGVAPAVGSPGITTREAVYELS